jgi:hypothetical protein
LDACYPILPAQIEKVEMGQDVTLVEVREENTGVRRARFYKKTDRGWLHTSPKLNFWQPAVEMRYADLTVLGHRRDLPHAGPMLEHISSTASEVCKAVGCSPDAHLAVEVVPRREVGTDLPRYEKGRLLMDSPWLLGIPIEQTLDEVYYARLTRATVQAVVDGTLAACRCVAL